MTIKKCVMVMLLCSVCCLFWGCTAKMNPLFEEGIETPSELRNSIEKENTSYRYLSNGICVIPKKSQTRQTVGIMASSKAALAVNDTTGTMLYSKHIYEKVYPASVTKIVTAWVTLKYGNLEDVVTVSHNAANITEYGAKLCGFQEGDTISLEQLLYSFLIYSGNDAGIAIAEHISGSVEEFAKLMNREMKFLGANHSHFVNPHGLHDNNHYTTAYDLYLVFHALLKNETFQDIIHHAVYEVSYQDKDGKNKNATFYTTNRYLLGTVLAPSGMTVMGGKTGTTQKAGSCLILYSKNAKNEDIITVVLKAQGVYDLYEQMNYLVGCGN